MLARPLLLLAVVVIAACHASERDFGEAMGEGDMAFGTPDAPLSVEFDNEPETKDSRANIVIGVYSKNGTTRAVEYKYALIEEENARGGSEACASASYSEFLKIDQTIILRSLTDGYKLLCAIGKALDGRLQSSATTYYWEKVAFDASSQPDQGVPSEEPDFAEKAVDIVPPEPPEEEEPTPLPPSTPNNNNNIIGAAAILQVAKEGEQFSSRGIRDIYFDNGDDKVVNIRVKNSGNKDLHWYVEVRNFSAPTWLEIEYSSQVVDAPYRDDGKIFEGILAAGNETKISFRLTKPLQKDYIRDLHRAYVQVWDKENSNRVPVTVSLFIPKIEVEHDGQQQNRWHMSIPRDGSPKRVYINNWGKGNLKWTAPCNADNLAQNAPWLSIRVESGYIELSAVDVGTAAAGVYAWVCFDSNSGKSFAKQKVAGQRWLKVILGE